MVCHGDSFRPPVLKIAVFSSRLPPRLTTNAFSAEIAALRRQWVPLTDLTVTNPTAVDLAYPADVLSGLADPLGATYDPSPFGMRAARDVVAKEVSSGGGKIDARQVILTASTSEAYSLLFKLLCDPGDRVLTPEPSYPLFELLTRLDAVVSAPYRLEQHGAWSIDRDSVERAWTPGTRALLVVSPNNPTGSMLRRDDREWLVVFARAKGLALISDEVFSGYPIDPRPDASSLLGEDRVLTFTLGGLSKSAGLPQVKLGWVIVSGPAAQVKDATTRLEVICDTYLSVSTPVQVAASRLIAAGAEVRAAIQARIRMNYRALRAAAQARPAARVLPPEGGWSAVVQVPSTIGEEALVLRILQEARVIVHPGYFFDFHGGTHLIVSLLPDPAAFARGIDRALEIAV